MNLTTDGWIPVANAKGERDLLSLRDVFANGHQWQDFAVRPHERVALMRLLICVAQAALKGPMTSGEDFERDLPTRAEAYLQKWQDRFELFHPEHPFLQFPGLSKIPKLTGGKRSGDETEEDGGTAASKLDFALATGNNTTLFDHSAATSEERRFSAAQLPLMLITFQCFSPGGRIGVARWEGSDTPGKGSSGHAPCCPSAMLHAFIRRESVFATIASNVLSFETVNRLYRHDGWGLPVWEWMPRDFSDGDAIKNATETYLGRLMPLSRAVLLRPEGMNIVLANGLDYPSPPDFPPEPSASLVKKRDGSGHILLGAGERGIWRELPALVVRRKLGEAGGPLTISALSDQHSFDLWIGALKTDKASILDTVECVFPIPAKMLSDAGRTAYEGEVTYADEKVGHALSQATETYRRLSELKPQGYRERRFALRHYWNAVEQLLPMLNAYIAAEDGTQDQAGKRTAWRTALWKTAKDAYAAACAFETPRQRRAYSLGLGSLQFTQRKADQPEPETAEAA